MGERKRAGITRERADRVLTAIVREAEAINADPHMLHSVVKLSVFGSYLGDKLSLGDLDVAYAVATRVIGSGIDERTRAFAEAYPPPRSVARNWFQRMLWPEAYLARRLKVARGISLHEHAELDSEGYPHRVIFEGNQRVDF
ncbi:MAG TPA: hypothetical protein VF636_04875 [Sphingomonas sp.]|jgi:hypothetical protein